VDGLLFMAVFIPVYVVLVMGASSGSAEPQAGVGILLLTIAGAGLILVYEGLMLSSRGQTLGKMAVGIKVVTPEGRDIGVGHAWGRAFVRQVFFSYFALLNYLPALFTKQRTAVHDLAAKTRVVRFRR
jgi:uncharacterized RDD family membrane protein YckC